MFTKNQQFARNFSLLGDKLSKTPISDSKLPLKNDSEADSNQRQFVKPSVQEQKIIGHLILKRFMKVSVLLKKDYLSQKLNNV
jgi:hypothetical protein